MTSSNNIEVLFGKIAVACGYVTTDEVQQAIETQQLTGESRHLGRIMIEMGVITEEQLMTVLAIQRENRFRTEMSNAVREAGMTLGELAVARGYCTDDQIGEAIEEQARLERFNLFFRLGEVLVSKSILTLAQVHELLNSQNITIMGCPGCFSRFNVMHYKSGTKVPCPKCGTTLTLPASQNQIKVDGQIKEGAET